MGVKIIFLRNYDNPVLYFRARQIDCAGIDFIAFNNAALYNTPSRIYQKFNLQNHEIHITSINLRL